MLTPVGVAALAGRGQACWAAALILALLIVCSAACENPARSARIAAALADARAVADSAPPGEGGSPLPDLSALADASPEGAGDATAAQPTTPLARNGRLAVCGTNLCNSQGKQIQLRGMSSHGLQWYGWGDCLTPSSLDALAQDWGADILRLSMYLQEGGYETDPPGYRAMIDTLVDQARARGMYALIDFHLLDPGDPWFNIETARSFFSYMAQQHGSKQHVLYEICNEPSGVSWSRIKSYAEEIIPLIRQHDPAGIIIVGTEQWSSLGLSGDGPQAMLDDLLSGPLAQNVMYTLHFYAASHDYLAEVETLADQLPIFVTEFGTQEYTGDGQNDIAAATRWIDLLAAKKISWCNWNYSDDFRSGAVFQSGTCLGGPFTGANLKQAGTLVFDWLNSPADDF